MEFISWPRAGGLGVLGGEEVAVEARRGRAMVARLWWVLLAVVYSI